MSSSEMFLTAAVWTTLQVLRLPARWTAKRPTSCHFAKMVNILRRVHRNFARRSQGDQNIRFHESGTSIKNSSVSVDRSREDLMENRAGLG